MARSAALNPASMPFFPGGLRGSDDERGSGLGFGHQVFRELDRGSVSSHSVSSSDYRSVRSSPSPPQGRSQELRHQPSPVPRETQRQSPTIRQTDAGRPYPPLEVRSTREGSMLGTLGTLPEGEDNHSSEEDQAPDSGHQTPGSYPQQPVQQEHVRERLPTLPFSLGNVSGSFSGMYTSPSPVSSQESNSRATSAMELQTQNFEAQLKASPMIRDILERLVRCEYTTREIQQDLGEISHKVNMLLERALSVNNQPEFKDPFASNSASYSMKPRPSIGNIAPNQPANTDDITSISQRLNTLTSSVGQLLVLQTQQMQQTSVVEGRNKSAIGLNSQLELAPNQVLSPPGLNNLAMLGPGLPNRPDLRLPPRQPNPPARTWSAGNLDPVRPAEQNLSRQDLRDKRRSVSGLLRRDSSGVSLAKSSLEKIFKASYYYLDGRFRQLVWRRFTGQWPHDIQMGAVGLVSRVASLTW